MKRSHAVFVVAAAMLIGCSDAQTSSTAPAVISKPTTTGPATLHGTVTMNPAQEILPMLDLRLDDGTLIGLVGQEALSLVSVLGAEVEVVGMETGESTVEVDHFIVLSVGGRDAADGILELAENGAYSLRLTAGGTLAVIDPPDELIAHVGERVWLVETNGAVPTAFGVIQP